jgi:hypothetical protein
MTATLTQTILLIGETGVGKSTLGNALLNTKAFTTGRNLMGVTDTTMPASMLIDGINRCVLDTPGFEDPHGNDADERHLSEMVNYLRGYKKGIHVIALVVQTNDVRLTLVIQKIIQQLNLMFNNPDVWKYFSFVFSFWNPAFGINRDDLSLEFKGTVGTMIMKITGINYMPDIPTFFVDSLTYPINYIPDIPTFFVDSLISATNQDTRIEIAKFYEFATSLEKPVSTNRLIIPDSVCLTITTRRETRCVKTESIQIAYETDVEYVEQVSKEIEEEYDSVEMQDFSESYSEPTTVAVPYQQSHCRRIFGIGVHHYSTTEWRHETRWVTRTRTVQRPVTVKRKRLNTIWVPEPRMKREMKYRDGVRKFWEEIEIETRRTYSGRTLPESSHIVNTWTDDI